MRYDKVLPHVESRNADESGSRRLGGFFMDKIGLYAANTEEIPIFNKAASTQVETKLGQLVSTFRHSRPVQGGF